MFQYLTLHEMAARVDLTPHAEVMKITGHTQMRTFMRYLNLVDTTMQNTAALLANYVENNNS